MAKKKELTEDIEKTEEQEKPKKRINSISVLSGNKTMEKASQMKPSKTLFPHLVFDGECVCLFSDTNVGKSIFAVQMGVDIAEYHKKRVVYYDFELSARQFYARYSDDDGCFIFPETFYRAEMKPDASTEFILEDIEDSARSVKAQVIIIDNLTWLCADAEDGASAATFMKQIKHLQRKYGWTIIVVAHTPKLAEGMTISVNNLAGSKQLSNFFDSIFSIGRQGMNKDGRYLKQVKTRAEKPTFDSRNVALYNIEKKDRMLQFVYEGTCIEEVAMMDEMQRQILDMIEGLGMDDMEISKLTGETTANIRKIRRYAKKPDFIEVPDEEPHGDM